MRKLRVSGRAGGGGHLQTLFVRCHVFSADLQMGACARIWDRNADKSIQRSGRYGQVFRYDRNLVAKDRKKDLRRTSPAVQVSMSCSSQTAESQDAAGSVRSAAL